MVQQLVGEKPGFYENAGFPEIQLTRTAEVEAEHA
jgi:hypothetical protein